MNHDALPEIEDAHKRGVVAQLLENQEKAQAKKDRSLLRLFKPLVRWFASCTATGPVAGFDPVLISLIRRSMPQLIAYDIAGVQPMTGPTGLIFAMRASTVRERSPPVHGDYREAFFNGFNAGFSGADGNRLADYDPTASICC